MKSAKEIRFEEIYAQHRDRIFRLCLGFAKGEVAQDLFQEILIKIWKHLDSFRGESEISTWLYRISYNCAITFSTKEKKLESKQNELPESLNLIDPEYVNSELELQLHQLYHAIGELPELDRIIATLLLENTSYRGIAEISGISENYVAVKVNRIKATLTQKLNPNGK
jgi:RNA polymerase sigma-70 factor (ECF subfamily)